MREKRPLNPAEAWRRKEKQKVQKGKKAARLQRLKQVPVERRDPYFLISEIQRYAVLEHEGKLDGSGRTRKKQLLDQFNSLRKARQKAGLDPIELPVFDPDAYESKKKLAIESLVDKGDLPALPAEECPYSKGVPGLPPYRQQPKEEEKQDTRLEIRGEAVSYQKAAKRKKPPHSLDPDIDRLLCELGQS